MEVLEGTRHSTDPRRRLAPLRAARALGILLLVCGAACARPSPAPDPGSLVVGIESGPITFDPRVLTDQASWRVADVVFNGLVRKGERGELAPDLAASVETADARVWRCRLREGVRFHDGRPLTSRDVAFTFRSLLAEGFVSSKQEPLRVVERIETPGPDDVVFHLREPYASFPSQLLLGILPEGTTPEEARSRPVGTGPYRLVDYRPDDRVVLERWEGHFGPPAALPRLVYRIVPDATTRALELLRGSVHLVVNALPPDVLPRLASSPGLAVTVRPGANYAYLCFNLRDPVLGKRDVRRALALALDRPALVHGLWRDTVEETETLLPPGHWARAGDLPPLRRDLAEARRLLDRAGFADPGDGRPRLTLSYKTSTDEMALLQATAVAEQWREAGVETRIRSSDFAVFYQDVVRGSFQLFSLRWQGIVDPDHYRDVFHSGAVPPRGWNRGFFSDPLVDAWIAQARRTADRELRRELYGLLQRRVAEELPYLSLYTARNVAVHDARLSGLEEIPQTGDFTFLPRLHRR
ncbi:MAG: ABC transporter substrate-binding protein [Acidobacteria bacterium]|nr:MAG: ABC transporter substrate-binding protein [Acidobacteriota bacterium]MCE7957827.1 ABC transporter substrate-binding protein [Acidobacteria bacterium ACB2]